ncbi:hypothetical protein [Mucilaginibacter gotjawali]|uniref:Uncharacterized protein n=2 Tax=Mucilaginibacter gotjawali TaxID=1550579 RepID=A0A839SNC8_9SPHI|nr:hypothetical protein [Mucilaginibacter gotjawali]MBB3058734.1 hypothetical protein [Mucilaginibacter gotjawali]BAU55662.1 hypothetical protein MgSA37_03853 [Mucilaginibacter gotjawali]
MIGKDSFTLAWLQQLRTKVGRRTDPKLLEKVNQFSRKCTRYKQGQVPTVPYWLIIVCGGKVSGGLRQKARSYGLSNGISGGSLWSGSELEEKIRKQAPEILQRFFEGQPFPETGKIF